MTVKAILADKGRSVVTISPTISLSTAIKILAENRIGAVVVTNADHGLEGILSERDLVRALAEHGASVLNEPVEKVMTRKVVTCVETDTVNDMMERMTAGKFRHVPVLEEGRIAGIVSIGDVVKHRLMQIENESNALREYILTA